MSDYRFKVGTSVMCNFGQEGWKLGRIIALNYREETWAEDIFAPYQVLLEENHSLIYVPEDDNRFCREAALEDINILKRKDALAAYQSDVDEIEDTATASPQHGKLSCTVEPGEESISATERGDASVATTAQRIGRTWNFTANIIDVLDETTSL